LREFDRGGIVAPIAVLANLMQSAIIDELCRTTMQLLRMGLNKLQGSWEMIELLVLPAIVEMCPPNGSRASQATVTPMHWWAFSCAGVTPAPQSWRQSAFRGRFAYDFCSVAHWKPRQRLASLGDYH
jgi:hypothetical protein